VLFCNVPCRDTCTVSDEAMPRRIKAERVCKGSAARLSTCNASDTQTNRVATVSCSSCLHYYCSAAGSGAQAGGGSAFDRHAHLVQYGDSVVICVFKGGKGLSVSEKVDNGRVYGQGTSAFGSAKSTSSAFFSPVISTVQACKGFVLKPPN
jgi:hypothetical protein